MTLRMQITLLFSFLFFSCLTVVGVLVYQDMTRLVKDIATRYIKETIIQVNGKIDQTLSEVDNTSSTALGSFNLQVSLNKTDTYLTLPERTQISELVLSTVNQNPYVSALLVYSPRHGFFGFNNSAMQCVEIKDEVMARLPEPGLPGGQIAWMASDKTFNNHTYIFGIRTIPNFLHDHALGYFLAVVDADKIGQDLRRINIGSGGQILLVNENGRQIISSSSLPESTLKQFTAIMKEQETQAADNGMYTVEGTKTLVMHTKSLRTEWTTVVALPRSTLTLGMDDIQKILIWIYILTVLFIFISAGILSAMISRPIRGIQRAMRHAEGGNFNYTLPRTRVKEINALSHSFNTMTQKLKQLIEQVFEGELRQREAKMKVLQAHINPHFLYNTLDSFYWLLQMRGQDGLAKDIVALSNLFRYSIGTTEEFVPIESELEHVRNYVRMQQLRFEKLRYTEQIDPAALSVFTLRLLLQPLVENAISHGIENQADEGLVEVTVLRDGNIIRISVKDNGTGIQEDRLRYIRSKLSQTAGSVLGEDQVKMGLGLENVSRRIKLAYGEPFGLDIWSRVGAGTVVGVRIPAEWKGDSGNADHDRG